MRTFFFLLLLLGAQSCATMMDAADLNTSGVVRSSKPVTKRPDGNMEYLLEVNPQEKFYIRLVTFEKFKIGDTVCVHTQAYKLTTSK